MTIEHSNITGAEVHESKGVDTATVGQVYVTDGAGSGSWVDNEPKGVGTAAVNKVYVSDGAGSGSFKSIYSQGWEDYNDTGLSQPLPNNAFVDLTNDGAGAFTNKTYKLPDGRGDIWDTSSNEFDWSGAGLVLGDTVDIRFDVVVNSSSNNDEFILALDMAHGSGGEYQLEVFDLVLKAAGIHHIPAMFSVYMGDINTLNNPAKVVMKSDDAGDSVVVNGWYVRTVPRNPIMV